MLQTLELSYRFSKLLLAIRFFLTNFSHLLQCFQPRKERLVDERRVFQKDWTEKFFFIEERGKPFCLKCKKMIAVMKKENLKRHYETNHPELQNLDRGA